VSVLSIDLFYVLAGVVLAFVAVRSVWNGADRQRWGTAGFWGLLAVIYLFGKSTPPALVGWMMLLMVGLAASKQVGRPAEQTTSAAERRTSADLLQNSLFLPALVIPGTAIIGTLVLDKVHWGGVWLLDHKQPTLAALGLGGLVAVVFALRLTRSPVTMPLREGSRLLHAIGWALILPQLLAALGGVFSKAGVGPVVADVVVGLFPTHIPAVAVAVYCLGMALFTICMGNAFAAFPVITLGIGLPLIVQKHGGNPAIMAALGMLSGYCGTLVTPMAANFNIVPVMLLEIRDQNAVIKAQAPLAALILLANIVLMIFCVYRF
jgi:uncharacterized membrane protein